MEKLAIFDIDYTLTKKETSIELYKYMLKRDKSLIKYIPAHILTVLGYGVNVFDATRTKERFLKFLSGTNEEELKSIVRDFYRDHISNLLYEDGLKAIKEYKAKGYKVYLISASPEFYVNEFYNIEGVDKVIGTKFKMNDGKFEPIVVGKNCKGEEKVKRLMEELKKDNIEVDFKNSVMFSDSLSDLPLLQLAGTGYLINYNKKHDLKILRWK
ncbi:HAD family hydrolase [Clostridium culturomicium]|uniref:HAD family hydrolase n=1 Tax=Clostridium culturomicium TaxID=1499683 RepID=UPI00058CC8FC|nr:HAD family hydrolase [Clostridium culturomicium]